MGVTQQKVFFLISEYKRLVKLGNLVLPPVTMMFYK